MITAELHVEMDGEELTIRLESSRDLLEARATARSLTTRIERAAAAALAEQGDG